MSKKKKPNRRINRLLLLAAMPVAYAASARKIFRSIRNIFAALVLALAGLTAVAAAQPVYAATTVTVTSSTYGANGSDTKDDTAAIQKALDLAKNKTKYTADNHLIVKIPKGTYYLTNTLYILSNTELELTADTTIIMKKSDVYYMLRNKHIHSNGATGTGGSSICTTTNCGAYKQSSNIKVTGGTWKQSQSANCATGIISIRHAQNVDIAKVKSYYATDHYFNLSATKNTTVTDCKFYSARTYSGNKEYQAKEAVHLDSADKEGEPNLYPQDNTPCSYATVTGCTFSKVHGGVGTHHTTATKKGTTIKVKNCTFRNLDGRAINFANFNDSQATGNTVDHADVFMTVLGCKNVTVSGNTVDTTASSFFKGYESTQLKVKDNSFVNGSTTDTNNTNGLYFEKVSGTISGNTVKKVPGNGIYFKFGGIMTISGNTVSDCGCFGILAMGTSAKYAEPTIKSNTVSSTSYNNIKVGDCTRNAVVEYNTLDGSITKAVTCESCTINYNTYTANKGCARLLSLANAETGIKVTLRKSYGWATAYQIYRSVDGGSYKRVRTIQDGSTLAWTDTGVTDGQVVKYKMRSVCVRGDVTEYTPYGTVMTMVRLPRPVMDSVTAGSSCSFKVMAPACSAASGYEIMYADNSSFTGSSTMAVTGAFPSVGKMVRELKSGTKYYVKMRYVKTLSGTKYYSAWSKYKTVTAK